MWKVTSTFGDVVLQFSQAGRGAVVKASLDHVHPPHLQRSGTNTVGDHVKGFGQWFLPLRLLLRNEEKEGEIVKTAQTLPQGVQVYPKAHCASGAAVLQPCEYIS